MQLIDALASGVAGAGLGTATIYRRGTSLRPTLYASFEGDLSPFNGADVDLDSNGRALVYVNELVDVAVRDSDGTEVVVFTQGEASPNVEVRSLSFTGTNYETGQQLPGNPTTAQEVFDRWLASAGAIDWKVAVNGVATNLNVALASTAGLFFNVKSPAYGAVGDGITDDTAAIQAAITAATTEKGIVFFPAGFYRTTSALTIPVDVSLWGAGPGASFIEIDHATANTLTYGAGTSAGYQEIRGLNFQALQSNTGVTVNVTNAGTRRVAIINCRVQFVLNLGHCVNLAGDSHQLLVDASEFRVAATNKQCVQNNGDNSLASVELRNSTFYSLPAVFAGSLVTAVNLLVANCKLDMSASTSGNPTAITLDGNTGKVPRIAITGSVFSPTSGAGSTALALNAFATGLSGMSIAEAGNLFLPGFDRLYFGIAQTAANPRIILGSREGIEQTSTDNTATVDVLAPERGVFVLTRTAAGAQVISTSAPVPAGGKFTFVVFNNSGGAITLSFGTGFATNTPNIAALANGKLATYQFVSVYLSGGIALVPLAAYTTVL